MNNLENNMVKKNIATLEHNVNTLFHHFLNEETRTYNFKLSTDFYIDFEENNIYFSITILNRFDRLFSKYLKNKFNFIVQDQIDIFLTSLLHEVGHDQTVDEFYEQSYFTILKTKIQKTLINLFSNSDRIAYKYFNVLDEFYATDWAVSWIDTHYNDYLILREELIEILETFYQNVFNDNKIEFSQLDTTTDKKEYFRR